MNTSVRHAGFGPVSESPIEFIDRYAYQIGPAGFLSPAGQAMEVVAMQPIYWVPRLPAHVLGITSIHGLLMPVISLATLWAPTAPARDAAHWLLVIGQEHDAVAFSIDTLPVRRRFDRATQLDAADCPAALQPHVRAAYPDDAGTATRWLDFDHASYLAHAFG